MAVVSEHLIYYYIHQSLVLLTEDVELRFGVALVADGYLTRRDVRQGIDEQRRRRVVVRRIGDGREISLVSNQRTRLAESLLSSNLAQPSAFISSSVATNANLASPSIL